MKALVLIIGLIPEIIYSHNVGFFMFYQLQDIEETPQITLYKGKYFRGGAVNFAHEVTDLTYYQFNDQVLSIKVKNGM